jgi:hypothetical protein
MARIAEGSRSRIGWYDRSESVAPGTRTTIDWEVRSPCSAYERVRPFASVTFDTSTATAGSY